MVLTAIKESGADLVDRLSETKTETSNDFPVRRSVVNNRTMNKSENKIERKSGYISCWSHKTLWVSK